MMGSKVGLCHDYMCDRSQEDMPESGREVGASEGENQKWRLGAWGTNDAGNKGTKRKGRERGDRSEDWRAEAVRVLIPD